MHCLYAYVVKEDAISEDIKSSIKYSKFSQGFILVDPPMFSKKNNEEMRVRKEFSKQNPIALVSTDYFGGVGEQHAYIWEGGTKKKFKTINVAMKRIGVVKEGEFDEFDTIHLGRFRENGDIGQKEES